MKRLATKKDRGMALSLWMNQETLDEIDKTAEWAELTRSKLIQNLIEVGIEEMNIFKTLGIIKLTLVSLDLKKQWQRVQSEIKDLDVLEERRITDRGINVSIWVSRDHIQDIETLSKKLNLSRSQLVELMIDMGMSDMRKLRKVGVITIAKYFRDLHKKWKTSFKDAQKAYSKGSLNLEKEDKDTM